MGFLLLLICSVQRLFTASAVCREGSPGAGVGFFAPDRFRVSSIQPRQFEILLAPALAEFIPETLNVASQTDPAPGLPW